MKTAYIGLREGVHYRREIFASGLKHLGYRIDFNPPSSVPNAGDVLCIWNRYSSMHECANRFESVGASVLVCENAYLCHDILGGSEKWMAISRNHHVGAGTWPIGGPERWDRLNVKLTPFRTSGSEVVVLKQRGIGEPGVAMPANWRAPGRVRHHPGKLQAPVTLQVDLKNASAVATWASSAAIKALLWGIPVIGYYPQWIGYGAASAPDAPLNRSEDARLQMLRRMIWAQWHRDEIASGEAFAALLET
jgi:hypothetical protein